MSPLSARRGKEAVRIHVDATSASLNFMARARDRGVFCTSDWRAACSEDGSVSSAHWVAALEHIGEKGIKEPETKRELWPLLLGVLQPSATKQASQAALEAYRGAYQQLIASCKETDEELTQRMDRAVKAQAQAQAWEAQRRSTETALLQQQQEAVQQLDKQQQEQLLEQGQGQDGEGESQGQGQQLAQDEEPYSEQQTGAAAGSSEHGAGEAPQVTGTAPAAAAAAPAPAEEARGGSGKLLKISQVPAQQPLWGLSISALDLPQDLRQFYEVQRIIVVDAVRTDFKKNSLTAVDAISSWVSSALADSSVYHLLSSSKNWENGRHEQEWVSSLARHHLHHITHLASDQKRQVLRLVRLLSAYAAHDPETGYSQGMSDLALPFLLVLEDEALAFWCFERLMRKVRGSFSADGQGILQQLSRLQGLLSEVDPHLHTKLQELGADDCRFAYRMVVVLMRRELPLEQALRLWEALWADDLLEAMPAVAERRRQQLLLQLLVLQQSQQQLQQLQQPAASPTANTPHPALPDSSGSAGSPQHGGSSRAAGQFGRGSLTSIFGVLAGTATPTSAAIAAPAPATPAAAATAAISATAGVADERVEPDAGPPADVEGGMVQAVTPGAEEAATSSASAPAAAATAETGTGAEAGTGASATGAGAGAGTEVGAAGAGAGAGAQSACWGARSLWESMLSRTTSKVPSTSAFAAAAQTGSEQGAETGPAVEAKGAAAAAGDAAGPGAGPAAGPAGALGKLRLGQSRSGPLTLLAWRKSASPSSPDLAGTSSSGGAAVAVPSASEGGASALVTTGSGHGTAAAMPSASNDGAGPEAAAAAAPAPADAASVVDPGAPASTDSALQPGGSPAEASAPAGPRANAAIRHEADALIGRDSAGEVDSTAHQPTITAACDTGAASDSAAPVSQAAVTVAADAGAAGLADAAEFPVDPVVVAAAPAALSAPAAEVSYVATAAPASEAAAAPSLSPAQQANATTPDAASGPDAGPGAAAPSAAPVPGAAPAPTPASPSLISLWGQKLFPGRVSLDGHSKPPAAAAIPGPPSASGGSSSSRFGLPQLQRSSLPLPVRVQAEEHCAVEGSQLGARSSLPLPPQTPVAGTGAGSAAEAGAAAGAAAAKEAAAAAAAAAGSAPRSGPGASAAAGSSWTSRLMATLRATKQAIVSELAASDVPPTATELGHTPSPQGSAGVDYPASTAGYPREGETGCSEGIEKAALPSGEQDGGGTGACGVRLLISVVQGSGEDGRLSVQLCLQGGEFAAGGPHAEAMGAAEAAEAVPGAELGGQADAEAIVALGRRLQVKVEEAGLEEGREAQARSEAVPEAASAPEAGHGMQAGPENLQDELLVPDKLPVPGLGASDVSGPSTPDGTAVVPACTTTLEGAADTGAVESPIAVAAPASSTPFEGMVNRDAAGPAATALLPEASSLAPTEGVSDRDTAASARAGPLDAHAAASASPEAQSVVLSSPLAAATGTAQAGCEASAVMVLDSKSGVNPGAGETSLSCPCTPHAPGSPVAVPSECWLTTPPLSGTGGGTCVRGLPDSPMPCNSPLLASPGASRAPGGPEAGAGQDAGAQAGVEAMGTEAEERSGAGVRLAAADSHSPCGTPTASQPECGAEAPGVGAVCLHHGMKQSAPAVTQPGTEPTPPRAVRVVQEVHLVGEIEEVWEVVQAEVEGEREGEGRDSVHVPSKQGGEGRVMPSSAAVGDEGRTSPSGAAVGAADPAATIPPRGGAPSAADAAPTPASASGAAPLPVYSQALAPSSEAQAGDLGSETAVQVQAVQGTERQAGGVQSLTCAPGASGQAASDAQLCPAAGQAASDAELPHTAGSSGAFDLPPEDLFLYVVAAAVVAERHAVMEQCAEGDDVLKHFQAPRIDPMHCLARARGYRALRQQHQLMRLVTAQAQAQGAAAVGAAATAGEAAEPAAAATTGEAAECMATPAAAPDEVAAVAEGEVAAGEGRTVALLEVATVEVA